MARAVRPQATRAPRQEPRGRASAQQRRSRPPRSQAQQRQAAVRAHLAREAKLRRRRRLRWISLFVAAVLVVGSLLWLIWFSLKKIEEHAAPADPARAFDPVPCQIRDLTTELSREGNIGGQPITIAVAVKNTGSKVPCSMETSDQDFKVTIETGDVKVFDSQTCEAGISAARLLLDKDVATTQKFTWNGMYSAQMCAASSPAAPGSYVARVYYMGEEMTPKGLPFEIIAAPSPTN